MGRIDFKNISDINVIYVIFLNTLSLLAISIIFLSDSTINYILSFPQGVIFLKTELSESSVGDLLEYLKTEKNIAKLKYNNQQNAQNEFFKSINNIELNNTLLSDVIPGNIEITLKKFEELDQLEERIKSKDQVQDVKFINSNIEKIKLTINLFRIFSIFLIIVILIIICLKIFLLAKINSKTKTRTTELKVSLLSLLIYALIITPLILTALNLKILDNNKVYYLIAIITGYSFLIILFSTLLTLIKRKPKKGEISSILS